MSYQDQLNPIHNLLNNSDPVVQKEGYDLLFDLWLKNIDSSGFTKDLSTIAWQNNNLVTEFKKRLNKFDIKSEYIDDYINKKFKEFEIMMSVYLSNKIESGEQNRIIKHQIPILDIQVKKEPFWSNPSRFIMISTTVIAGIIGLVWFIPKNGYTILDAAIVAIYIVGIIDFMYVLPKNENTTLIDLFGLKLSYKAPVHLSQHDENTFDISIENLLLTDFKGSISLIISDPDSTTTPLPGEKLSKELEIDYLDKETKQFKFRMTKRPASRNLSYKIKISPSDGSQNVFIHDNFLFAPIPYLRTTSNWLFGTLGTLIFALLWDQLKKLLGFE